MPNGNPYFNIDWLEDESLDIPDYLADIPNIRELMSNYLVADDDWTEEDYLEYGRGLDMGATYKVGEEEMTGQELWKKVGAEGFLSTIRDYDYWGEGIKKRKTMTQISQNLNKIDKANRLGTTETRSINAKTGKAGFAGSGQFDQMMTSHYGDVGRTVKGLTGNIKKNILGYESDVAKLRDKHVDDLWALYGDFLSTQPERGEKPDDVYTGPPTGFDITTGPPEWDPEDSNSFDNIFNWCEGIQEEGYIINQANQILHGANCFQAEADYAEALFNEDPVSFCGADNWVSIPGQSTYTHTMQNGEYLCGTLEEQQVTQPGYGGCGSSGGCAEGYEWTCTGFELVDDCSSCCTPIESTGPSAFN